MSLLLQYVLTVSSTVTATGIVYIAREAHKARNQVEANDRRSRENKRRSTQNRRVLYREGLLKPSQRRPVEIEENDG